MPPTDTVFGVDVVGFVCFFDVLDDVDGSFFALFFALVLVLALDDAAFFTLSFDFSKLGKTKLGLDVLVLFRVVRLSSVDGKYSEKKKRKMNLFGSSIAYCRAG